MAMEFWEKLRFYQKHGWAPVSTTRHSQEVREAIRDARFRPAMKQCFRNSQRLIILSELRSRLTYVEGLLNGYMLHAWLLLDGEILDLTLDEPHEAYSPHFTATPDEVQRLIVENDYYHGPLSKWASRFGCSEVA